MTWYGESKRHSLARMGIHNAHLYGKSMIHHITPADVDPHELALGIKVEMEHTPDRKIAERITLDHLTEYPQYYSKGLIPWEKRLKPRVGGN
jgi:hypothetical protein